MILALDIATKTGWAALTPDGRIVSGVKAFRTVKGRDHPGERLNRFSEWLCELGRCYGPFSTVAYEQIRFCKFVDATISYGELLGVVKLWAAHNGVAMCGIEPTVVKKHATGKGNAAKKDVIKAMRARGHTPADDNEADALALLRCHLRTED